MLGGNGEKLINLIISLFWELDIDYFSLLYYMKYCYFKIYKRRVFIYVKTTRHRRGIVDDKYIRSLVL